MTTSKFKRGLARMHKYLFFIALFVTLEGVKNYFFGNLETYYFLVAIIGFWVLYFSTSTLIESDIEEVSEEQKARTRQHSLSQSRTPLSVAASPLPYLLVIAVLTFVGVAVFS